MFQSLKTGLPRLERSPSRRAGDGGSLNGARMATFSRFRPFCKTTLCPLATSPNNSGRCRLNSAIVTVFTRTSCPKWSSCQVWSLRSLLHLLQQQLQDLPCGVRDDGAGAEDGGGAVLIEEIIVLRGDDAAADDHDIFAAEFFEFGDEGG